jgi:hypothetical protein
MNFSLSIKIKLNSLIISKSENFNYMHVYIIIHKKYTHIKKLIDLFYKMFDLII